MRTIVVILIMILVIPVFGQRRKQGDEDSGPVFTEGVIYSLPRRGIRLNIRAVREIFEPGPYSSYASQLLGINDVKSSRSVKWFIEDIEINTFSEPDPEHVYKALGEVAYALSLTPDGRLACINSDVDISINDFIKTNRYIKKPEREDGFSFANFNDTPIYTRGDSTNNYRPVRVSKDTKAAEAASRVLECRLSRFHMAAGLMDEFHPDGEAYRVSLDELERIENNYLSLFTGRTIYSTETFCFDFIPSPSAKGDVIFRFSSGKGVLPASDLSGKPVSIKVETVKELTAKYSSLASSENPMAGQSGLFYRMPAIADVSIIFELKTIASARIPLPQYGEIAPVPEELLTGDYMIEIHPETGAVKSVSEK
jgi:hypothetical protein